MRQCGFRRANAPDELSLRRPDGHTAIAHVAAGIARDPDIAVDVAARAIRPALDSVDHEVAEKLLVGELVVAPHVEGVHLAFAAGPGVTRPLGSTRYTLVGSSRLLRPTSAGWPSRGLIRPAALLGPPAASGAPS